MDAYYLSEIPENPKAIALKAMTDIDEIFAEEGLEKIVETIKVTPDNVYAHPLYRRRMLSQMVKRCSKLSDKLIFVQYPTNLGNGFVFPRYIRRVAKRNRVVYVIHDLNGLRYRIPIWDQADRRVFKRAYKIISHNENMTKFLVEKYGIPADKIIDLGIFDYITDKINFAPRHKEDGIAFAGNLAKSRDMIGQYIHLGIKAQLNLYGYKSPLTPTEGKYVSYCGKFPPDEVQMELKGGFGLVWDGTSVDDCKGLYGEYTKYNNPHKASLYIVSNLPLIVSNESAIAKYVLKHQIGFGVDSLREIPERIEKLSDEEYEKMRANLKVLSQKVAHGDMMRSIVKELLSE
jgi:hypothetical protein